MEPLFDNEAEPCRLTFDCHATRRERSLTNDSMAMTIQRHRRDAGHLQPNLRGVYTVKISPSLPKETPHVVLLLKIPKNELRIKKGRENFVVGQIVTANAILQIQQRIHDYIALNPQNIFADQTNIFELLPTNIPIKFLDYPLRSNFFSLSRCDHNVEPISPEGFAISEPTPNQKNACKSYKPGPFRFLGTPLTVQAKQLVANAVITLREKRQDENWRKMNEVKAVSALLNVHENTIYKVMQEYNDDDEFSAPKARKSPCPVTDIDLSKQELLYKVISGFYKKNQVPYFANIYEEFMKEANKGTSPQNQVQYKCSKSSFAKILHKNHYRYGRINERDAVLFKKNTMDRRKKYLELIAKYDADPEWDVVYQDETW